MSISNLEDEKSSILSTSKEELEKQDDELRQKDFIIKSLEEKLNTVEGYVHSLESNSLEVIVIVTQNFILFAISSVENTSFDLK